MKISFGIIVVDGMPFIQHQLRLIYPHAHEIFVCEGGDDEWEKLHGYRRSMDDTLETICGFPDPSGKIRLIQKRWRDKNHMCHEYSRRATGDIVWHIDIDEFIDPGHIPYIRELFELYPEYDAMAPPQVVFWGDTHTIVGVKVDGMGYAYEMPDIDRIYRNKKGLFIHHLPQRGYFDPGTGRIIPGKLFPDDFFARKNIYNFHFSYILPKSVQDKMLYYNERVPGSVKSGWFDDVFMKFPEKREEWIASDFDVQPIDPATGQNYACGIKPLDKNLPACLKDLEKDIHREIRSWKEVNS
jgi:hypothetical protein